MCTPQDHSRGVSAPSGAWTEIDGGNPLETCRTNKPKPLKIHPKVKPGPPCAVVIRRRSMQLKMPRPPQRPNKQEKCDSAENFLMGLPPA